MILGVAAAVLCGVAGSHAQAPSIGVDGSSGPGGAEDDQAVEQPPSNILIISVQRLTRNSMAGESIAEQAEALREQLLKPTQDRQEELRAEERELVALRDNLSEAEFDVRVEAFKTELREVRRAEQAAAARLQSAIRQATDRFRDERNRVLTEMMRRYDGAVMLDESTVVLSSNALDVTAEAIAALDASTPRIEVVLPDAAEE
ncbi:MAG: OmpH family outer membrane protein [Pseudomonadota bacterium]